MFLKKLSLSHYRNYEQLTLEVKSGVNLFVGPNAQGKTNLLEAIYVLALTKSHRTHQDRELIGWNREEASLYGEVDKKYGPVNLSLTLSKQGKKARVNGLEQRRLSEFIGSFNVVMFAPEDLEIVKGAPGIRRRFLDMEIGQVYPSYLYESMQYQKVLAQRNNFLKQVEFGKGVDEALLSIWDEQLARHGTKIMKKRQSFIEKLQVWAERIHSGITAGLEELKIQYKPSFAGAEEEESILFDNFMVQLNKVRNQDLRRGTTLIGPHRDDMVFSINGKEAHVFGSQGQQRTTALSLKLAELELIREEAGEYPILLLDDVLSELDQNRQTQLIETFQDKVQTFITTTGTESIDVSKLRDAAVFRVKNGGFQMGHEA
ncbi:DNA replication/repair protein RecF [Gorillibacterium timonense]|uniref:DNA replication/repair protein RecF n=1 Tax=Gorillibacterium timonense TaxID=1689269 RepID=UPI00071DBA55|nr:DNA replication/repair protein RecF [Gorillibacterium timonense]